MGDLDLFNKLIRDSILSTTYQIDEVSDHRFYFENRYAEAIKEYYELTYRKSNEFELFGTSKGFNCYKICSVASSARLCFLLLGDDLNSRFEWHLLNATSKKENWEKPSKNDAQLDAFDFHTYYECKCQEILEHKTPLPVSYSKCLEKNFGIKDLSVNGRNILATMKEFHLGSSDKNYLHTYFDIKQLFTHLCAIIKDNKELENRKLQYIFFTPKKELMKGTEFEKAYEELQSEINDIVSSDVIKIAKEKFNIDFGYEFISVDDDRLNKDPQSLLKYLKENRTND